MNLGNVLIYFPTKVSRHLITKKWGIPTEQTNFNIKLSSCISPKPWRGSTAKSVRCGVWTVWKARVAQVAYELLGLPVFGIALGKYMPLPVTGAILKAKKEKRNYSAELFLIHLLVSYSQQDNLHVVRILRKAGEKKQQPYSKNCGVWGSLTGLLHWGGL